MGSHEAHFNTDTIYRNLSAISWSDSLYDPRIRPWYTPPMTGHPAWTKVYMFAAEKVELGITVSSRINGSFSARWGRETTGSSDRLGLARSCE